MRKEVRVAKWLLALALVLPVFACGSVSAKGKVIPQIYMFGFSASFNDSVVYFTEIQQLDSVWVESGSGFLQGRENYSYQLRNYLADKLGMPNRTCVVSYAKDRRDAEKKYLKMKRLYVDEGKGMYDVRFVDGKDFKFSVIDMSYEVGEAPTAAPGLEH